MAGEGRRSRTMRSIVGVETPGSTARSVPLLMMGCIPADTSASMIFVGQPHYFSFFFKIRLDKTKIHVILGAISKKIQKIN